ncbi:hypothetical protein ABT294_44470 [Nonomuraea sp. NPDC000554]|uniref:hypothetical protein n=1 Tax=Nonomuraea sp. NPDC000554 TaxID=3154259 RepID=UPI0033195F3F
MILGLAQGALTQQRFRLMYQEVPPVSRDVAREHDKSPPGDGVQLRRRHVAGPRRPSIGIADQLSGAVTGTLDACEIARASVRQSTAGGDQRLDGGGSLSRGLRSGGGELECLAMLPERGRTSTATRLHYAGWPG